MVKIISPLLKRKLKKCLLKNLFFLKKYFYIFLEKEQIERIVNLQLIMLIHTPGEISLK